MLKRLLRVQKKGEFLREKPATYSTLHKQRSNFFKRTVNFGKIKRDRFAKNKHSQFDVRMKKCRSEAAAVLFHRDECQHLPSSAPFQRLRCPRVISQSTLALTAPRLRTSSKFKSARSVRRFAVAWNPSKPNPVLQPGFRFHKGLHYFTSSKRLTASTYVGHSGDSLSMK